MSFRSYVYKILKPKLGFEKNFNILPVKLKKKTNFVHRLLCNKGLTGDEFHYILEYSRH